jgi:hypothetical protein
LYPFDFNFFKTVNYNTINDLARELALVAFGSLGEIDKLWTQHILDGCVKMSFLHQRDGEQFTERWALLNQADWYSACLGRPTDNEENEDEPT